MVWTDNIMIQAASNAMERNIEIIHDDRRTVTIRTNNAMYDTIVLRYLNTNHYNSTKIRNETRNIDFSVTRDMKERKGTLSYELEEEENREEEAEKTHENIDYESIDSVKLILSPKNFEYFWKICTRMVPFSQS